MGSSESSFGAENGSSAGKKPATSRAADVVDFDPAAVDPEAFARRCAVLATGWKGRIAVAHAAARAKHVPLMIPVVIGAIPLGILLVAVIVLGGGVELADEMEGKIRRLRRWARHKAYSAYWDVCGRAKEAVLGEAFATIGLRYRRSGQRFSTEPVMSAGLVAKDKLKHLEDHITGVYAGVEFELSECIRPDQKGEDFDESDRESWRGLLLCFAVLKPFAGRTAILQDGGSVGNLFKGFGAAGRRVKLEDTRFEQRFAVFGTDQVEARYLLTPTFMERLVDLDRHFGGERVRALFADGRLFLAIDAEADLYELDCGEEGLDAASARRLLDELTIPCGIIDALNLNARTVA